MRASVVLFAPLSLLAGLVAASPANIKEDPADAHSAATGGRCCNGGTSAAGADHCATLGLNSFCCSEFGSNRKGGCDPFLEFPTGRDVKELVPFDTGCQVPGIRSKDPLPGFIGCA
ncbi:hypothetical protein LZ30DRAFT_822058 [Colletotrichum cereale]|nr:hypothetical protein LZ30DRAFT_822058 [Colletotrichum cereale]